MNLACPIDNRDDAIQKVSAVVASGVVQGDFATPSGDYVSHRSGTVRSDLASLLAPPAEPSQPGCLSSLLISYLGVISIPVVLGFGGLGALLPLMGFKEKWPAPVIMLLGAVGMVMVIISGVVFFFLVRFLLRFNKSTNQSSWDNYRIAKSAWDKTMARWNQLYYCHKHHIVFDPQNGEYCEPAAIKEFVLKQADVIHPKSSVIVK